MRRNAAPAKKESPAVDATATIERVLETVEVVEVVAAESAEVAALVGLVYVTDTEPGIRRKLVGKHFAFTGPDGKRITDAATIARVRALAIPPAYTDVWICPDPRGHLQATGRDARGRKQYRYHAEWRAVRDHGKFGKLIDFGERLPLLRKRLRRDLALSGLPREKVLAVVVSLLGETMIRVGNEEYARSNRSFGLTTLRSRHVAFVRDKRVLFKFRGKSGQQHEIAVTDRRLTRLVRRCQELPGQNLFQYVDDAGARQPIDSGMVNDYLRDAMGESFTAKDFRTWGGTERAAAVLARTPVPEIGGERAIASALVGAVKEVATELGNTPAVCRSSYIHPVVFEAWRDGTLQRAISPELARAPRKLEAAVLALLRRKQRQTSRAARKRPPRALRKAA